MRTARTLSGAAVLTTLALAGSGLATVSQAHATTPGGPGRIAFVVNEESNLEIYSIGMDGSELDNLTEWSGRDQDPAWSSDGTKIAFSSDRAEMGHLDIWTMDADGSDLLNLTPGVDATGPGAGSSGIEPSWSPSGDQVAYVHQGDVWVVSTDGQANRQNLTHDPAKPAAGQHPAWSPDGTKIAYIRDWDIWTMNADGSAKTQVTFTSAAEKYPDWSPDGLRLVYERVGQIYRMNADGSGQVLVSGGADKGGTRPEWSPEGDRISFSSSGYTAVNGPDLYVARPDGTAVTGVPTGMPYADHAPAWQPMTPAEPRATYLTAGVTPKKKELKVSGELFDANLGAAVKVTLSRKATGRFKKLATETATLTGFGSYATALDRPRSGTCKLVARFPGDAETGASSRTLRFSC